MTIRQAAAGVLACTAVVAAALAPAGAQAAQPAPPAPDLWAASDVFLPNLDDDSGRCTMRPGDLDRLDESVDKRLAACNDAADSVVNGAEDAKDLTGLGVRPMAVGERAAGRVSVPAADRGRVRLFVERGGKPVALGDEGRLTADELRSGVRLAVEGRDIVRDRARWDGGVAVTLTVTDRGATAHDTVALHVAPVRLQNDLQSARQVFAAAPGPGRGQPAEVPVAERKPGQWREFADSLRAASRASGLPSDALRFTPGTSRWWRDIWRQDIAEPGYVSMPLPGGGEQTMRILLRSPNHWASDDGRQASLRRAGRLLFRDLRGPGVGVVQQYTTDRDDSVDELLNFTGNVESLPPYAGHPHGRTVYGSSQRRRPDPSFTTMLDAQDGPSVVLDTSWLLVGHVDETVHVVRADNPRGWTLAVADPRLAVRLLKEVRAAGEGGQRLFAETVSTDSLTVDQFLGHEETTGFNEESAGHVDEQLRVLLRETGLRPQEIVRLPVLYVKGEINGEAGGAVAYSPALVNGLSLTARDYAAPDPHGPRVAGRDVFRQVTEERLAANGVDTHWVENFSWAHLGGGEVHCATNALRDISTGGARRPASAASASN